MSNPVNYRGANTYENEGGVKILVVLLHVLGVVLRRFSLVHGTEVKLVFFVLYGLEIHPHGLLDTITAFESARCCSRSCLVDNAPSGIDINQFYIPFVRLEGCSRDWEEG